MLTSVDITSSDAMPQPLFRSLGFDYGVTPDGKRFLTEEPVEDVTRVPLTLVTNWTAQR